MRSIWLAILFCSLGLGLVVPIAAEDSKPPLHAQIDALVERESAGHLPAAIADDAEFHRRIWLDFAGRIPTSSSTRTFLADTSADKRQKLLDELLAAPSYVDRQLEAFHVILMERRGENPAWEKFLRNSFEKNRPWDEMVRAMLQPQPASEADQGASFFLTKRLENYGQNPIDHPGLTRDIGRLFLGIDLQCAQCHNHLFVDEYTQAEFQGLYAVVQSLKIGKSEPFPLVVEKPLAKKLEFVSVFDPTQQAIGPRVPFGKEFEIPAELPKDSSYSPLALIATELPRSENPFFARNIANRLWHLLLGRGLIEPLDVQHTGNPATHPELMDLLTSELIAHKFDLKWLLREVALTKTYQRSSVLPSSAINLPHDKYLVAIPRRMSAEQFVRSIVQATSSPDEVDATATKLKPRVLAALANPAREPEDRRNPSVQSALFTSNDEELLALITRRPGNLLDRLIGIDDPHLLAEELYLSVFGRLPEDAERTELKSLLAEKPEQRELLLGHWLWGMVASTEFGVNH